MHGPLNVKTAGSIKDRAIVSKLRDCLLYSYNSLVLFQNKINLRNWCIQLVLLQEPAVSLSCYTHPTAGLCSQSFASTSRSIRPSMVWDLLGASEKQLQKSTSILVMSLRSYFRPHKRARLQPDGFFLKFHILEIYKICRHTPISSSKD